MPDNFKPEQEALFRQLASTGKGFEAEIVKALSEALLTSIGQARPRTVMEQVEILSAVMGRASAACVVAIQGNVPKAISKNVDASADAVIDRVAHWTREYIKLHQATKKQ
jgi:putative heme iron utilization protein